MKNNDFQNVVEFLESNGIKIFRDRIRLRHFFKRWWTLSFPYQDLDLNLPNKKTVISYTKRNKDLIIKRWNEYNEKILLEL